LSKPKKEKIPDIRDEWVNLWNPCATNISTSGVSGLTFNMDLSGAATAGTLPPSHEEKIEQLLTDIWHNQATMIKWLEKIYKASKK